MLHRRSSYGILTQRKDKKRCVQSKLLRRCGYFVLLCTRRIGSATLPRHDVYLSVCRQLFYFIYFYLCISCEYDILAGVQLSLQLSLQCSVQLEGYVNLRRSYLSSCVSSGSGFISASILKQLELLQPHEIRTAMSRHTTCSDLQAKNSILGSSY